MADEENNSEEVAKETTLQDMVEQLSESNVLQKSLQESSLKTTEVLTNIAKILQAQLDLSEREKLDKGRELDNPLGDDGGGGFKFDKLEMPTSVAEGIGMFLGAIVGSIGGFFSELRFLVNKSNVGITKSIKKLKNIFAETKLGQMFTRLNNSIKGFFSGLRYLLSLLKWQILGDINQKAVADAQKSISSFVLIL